MSLDVPNQPSGVLGLDESNTKSMKKAAKISESMATFGHHAHVHKGHPLSELLKSPNSRHLVASKLSKP